MILPNYIEIETSRYCNRQCPWCPNEVLQNRTIQELMPWPDLEKVIRILSQANYAGWLAFHNYNEPLANPRIVSELSFARAHLPEAKLTIFTNGDRLDSHMFAALVSAGLSQMRVTIYPKIGKEQAASHSVLYKWLARRPFLPEADWKQTVLKQGPALVHTGVPEVLLISPVVARYYDRGGTIAALSIANRKAPCLLTSNSLSIDYEGNIKMCCNVVTGNPEHTSYLLGNVREDDPLEIWNSKAFVEIRERHKSADWLTTPICKSCRQELGQA